MTRVSINAGDINSGAVLPDQNVSDGVMTDHILEGKLSGVAVAGHRWFESRYPRHPLRPGAVPARWQRVPQDDRVARPDAELRPGIWRGQSVLHVRVEERRPSVVALDFNNDQAPTMGVRLAHRRAAEADGQGRQPECHLRALVRSQPASRCRRYPTPDPASYDRQPAVSARQR